MLIPEARAASSSGIDWYCTVHDGYDWMTRFWTARIRMLWLQGLLLQVQSFTTFQVDSTTVSSTFMSPMAKPGSDRLLKVFFCLLSCSWGGMLCTNIGDIGFRRACSARTRTCYFCIWNNCAAGMNPYPWLCTGLFVREWSSVLRCCLYRDHLHCYQTNNCVSLELRMMMTRLLCRGPQDITMAISNGRTWNEAGAVLGLEYLVTKIDVSKWRFRETMFYNTTSYYRYNSVGVCLTTGDVNFQRLSSL